MNSAPPSTCPQCGKPLPAATPLGLCPECLLRAGLPSKPAVGGTGAPSADVRFQAPSPAELVPHFPQLEILGLIGQGGMGAVYKARQPALDRVVALKILRPRDDADPAFAERFAREARALAKLSHPNIVAVHDFGQAGGFHYLLMEFVDGTSLRQAMQAGRMAPREALAIVPPLCEALQYAHDRGIVHRDIKPENILLTRDGAVKVADFGLAKLIAATGVEADAALTGIGDVMGTPHYMAPEQVEHPQTVDHRADIYSLGVVLYQMLTGELPLGRFAPPSSRIRGMQVDVRLDEIVLRALEKEPERRYQQASEVKTEVETVVAGVPPPQPAPERDMVGEDSRCAEFVRLPATLLMGFFLLGLLSLVPMAFVFFGRFLPAVSGKLGVAESGFMAAMVLFTTAGIALSGFGAWAAHAARRLRSYRNAVAAGIGGIVALVFLNLIGLLTAAAGVWLLVVLLRADVRAAFQRHPDGVAYDPKRSRATRTAWLVLLGLVVVTMALTMLLIPYVRRGPGQRGKVESSIPSAAPPSEQPEEYRNLVRALVNRHHAIELDALLPIARDGLRQAQARYEAGIGDAGTLREAQLQVDFMAAEQAGSSDEALLAIRLQAARDKLVMVEARNRAGMEDGNVVADARDEVALLESVLTGDPVAPFRQLVAQRLRQHKEVKARYTMGIAETAEVNEAKYRLDLALIQLRRLEVPELAIPKREVASPP